MVSESIETSDWPSCKIENTICNCKFSLVEIDFLHYFNIAAKQKPHKLCVIHSTYIRIIIVA
jgi:hypothetical protein